jgi:hypothetical protein|tara:strand:- start:43 stop:390 length:348 start_codon:yes stop_codon:yes gene_type:complete
MDPKLIFLGFIYFVVSATAIWFQTHAQFFNEWSKDNAILVAIPGFVISYWSIKATENIAEAYDGAVWPARLIGFGIGIIIFSILTWLILGEKIEIKSAVCVLLAFCILIIQLFWK